MMRTSLAPDSAARNAAEKPALPPPITRMVHSEGRDMVVGDKSKRRWDREESFKKAC